MVEEKLKKKECQGKGTRECERRADKKREGKEGEERKRGEEGKKRWEGASVHNVSERQLEWG